MAHNQCVVGYIPGSNEVSPAQWNSLLTAFAEKVKDFNTRGQRQQISHPGFIIEYKFCPYCGKEIDRESLGL